MKFKHFKLINRAFYYVFSSFAWVFNYLLSMQSKSEFNSHWDYKFIDEKILYDYLHDLPSRYDMSLLLNLENKFSINDNVNFWISNFKYDDYIDGGVSEKIFFWVNYQYDML